MGDDSPTISNAPTNARASAAVRLMQRDDALAVAQQHSQGITGGFLSTLGDRFLAHLYRGIASNPRGFVFVAVDDAGRVVGFVAGADSVSRLYRSVLLRRGWLLAGTLIRHFLRPSTVRRIIETLRYPKQVEGDSPEPELLSIVVDPQWRGSGVASHLVDALVAEFRRRRCSPVKVIVGAGLDRANAFYVRYGFRLAGSITSHGDKANVYTIEVDEGGPAGGMGKP